MSQKNDYLDDSDLEDELLIMELSHQTDSPHPLSKPPVSQQQQQLNVILFETNQILKE